MNYTKITVTIENYTLEASEILIAFFAEKGFESFVELSDGFEAYIQSAAFEETMLKKESFPELIADFSYSIDIIPDQNWNEYWEKNYYTPITINNQCVVRSPFHEKYSDLEYQIVIEPKMSFGTGHHETTSMMMEFILENDMKEKQVLDMGCGTGILGIFAAMRGAKNVTAIDNDFKCTENCYENCQLNDIQNINILFGDANLFASLNKFDIIFANINKNILLEDIPNYRKVLKNNGTLILSGFYKNDVYEIEKIALLNNFFQKNIKEKNNWVAISYGVSKS